MSLAAPRPLHPHLLQAAQSWGYVSIGSTGSSCVEAAVLEFEVSQQDDLLHSQDFLRVASAFDSWFRLVGDWLEQWTGQVVRRPTIPGRESVLHAMQPDDPPQLIGSGATLGGGPVYVQLSDVAANSKVLSSAFRRASSRESIPLPYLLLRNSKLASEQGESRLAILESATAAELALVAAIARTIEPESSQTLELVLRKASGLMALDGRCRERGGRPGLRRDVLRKRLAQPRNVAIHRAKVPTWSAVSKAQQVARILVQKNVPLPSP